MAPKTFLPKVAMAIRYMAFAGAVTASVAVLFGIATQLADVLRLGSAVFFGSLLVWWAAVALFAQAAHASPLGALEARCAESLFHKGRVVIVLAVFILSWIFFQSPGDIFYNRYFESSTMFDPWWTITNNLSGWSSRLHLGYTNFQEIAYPSVITLLMVPVQAMFGTPVLSQVYPAALQLVCFFSMYAYIRKTRPGVAAFPTVLIAFFYAANPLVAGVLHEGYSGMLIDYALLPIALLIVDSAYKGARPYRLVAIPLLFILTGMYKIPEVAIDIAVIVALRYRELRSLIAAQRSVLLPIATAFALNVYWLAPMLFALKTHASLPVQADTSGEVAVTTHYSSLTNVVLLKVFGAFGADSGLCSGCGWYQGAWFLLAMALLAALAVWGIVKARRWRLLAVLIAALIFSTGYKYQDEIIGVPYQIIMGLPTFQVFRSASVALFICAFCYAVGATDLLDRFAKSPHVNRLYVLLFTIVALTTLPVSTGSIFERPRPGSSASFFVRVPPEYFRARAALSKLPTDGVTLLVPNQPFAAYTWGASINDFLPAFFSRPTLSALYWPQPSPFVDELLNVVTNPSTGRGTIAGLLSAMRIDSVFFHDDVIGAGKVNPLIYGVPFLTDGRYWLLRPRLKSSPLAESSAAIAEAASPEVAALYRAYFGTPAELTANPASALCNGGLYAAPLTDAARLKSVYVGDAIPCSGDYNVAVTAFAPKVRGTFMVLSKGHIRARIPARLSSSASGTLISARVHIAAGERLLLVRAGAPFSGVGQISEGVQVHKPPVRETEITWRTPAFGKAIVPPGSAAFILNESSDPSWIALAGGRRLQKFVANGYANGWRIHGATSVTILNLAEIVRDLAAVIALCLVGFLVFLLRSTKSRERVRLRE